MIDLAIQKKAARIKLLLMDCDGVLTNGQITLLPNGDEQKTFHVRDGQGIVLIHQAGLKSGIISGRGSSIVERRAQELGIEFVEQGVQDKTESLKTMLKKANVLPEETAFIGDDLADIKIMLNVGLAIAVADAADETKKEADLVTAASGGNGAIREAIEIILKSQQKWEGLLKKYFY